jgi:hypothetical protein
MGQLVLLLFGKATTRARRVLVVGNYKSALQRIPCEQWRCGMEFIESLV